MKWLETIDLLAKSTGRSIARIRGLGLLKLAYLAVFCRQFLLISGKIGQLELGASSMPMVLPEAGGAREFAAGCPTIINKREGHE